MIGHADKTEHLKTELLDRRLEPVQKSPVVALVPEDLLPPIATRHDMVDRTRELNT